MSGQCLHKIMFGKQKNKGQKKGAIIKIIPSIDKKKKDKCTH
jgi:hypothetical protein